MINSGRDIFLVKEKKAGRTMLVFFLLPLVMMLSVVSLAQMPIIKATVDKNAILIGEQFNYSITASFPSSLFKIKNFKTADFSPHFEVIGQSPVDTSLNGDEMILHQNIILTSFDSGSWKTPAFPVNFDPVKDDTTLYVFADSIPVKVSYEPDTTKDIRDIKPIREVSEHSQLLEQIAQWFFGICDLALICWIIVGLIMAALRKKMQGIDPETEKNAAPPFEEAMAALNELKGTDLSDQLSVKNYHTRLSEIFRRYATRKFQTGLMNKTTGEVLVNLQGNHISHEQVANLAAALRCGDAVKFAKYLPPVYESQSAFDQVKETIVLMDRSEKSSTN